MDNLPNPYETKVYRNAGNPPLIAMLGEDAKLILDVGCGAGDNAALLHNIRRGTRVFGITLSLEGADRPSTYAISRKY